MKIAVDVSETFGDDIRHLHGNLYRVRRSRIRMARAGVAVEKGKLVYGNPRWFVNKNGDLEARGIDELKMDELKTAIQNSGLDNPIRLRPVSDDGDFLEVVNGERRFRCIESLCDGDALCYDSAVGDKAPASEVYEWVDCRIEEMDDKTALGVALKTNETSEVIGDLANIQVVKAFRSAGYDDHEILLVTGKSLSWLRETDRIIGLDEVCLEHFEKDQITRKAALQLALIENAEERLSILEQIVSIAKGRHSSKIAKLEKKLEEAETNELINNSAARVAADMGDEEQAAQLSAAGEKAKKKADKVREEKAAAEAKPSKADARDIKKAKKEAKPKPAAALGVIDEYIQLIEQIIESEGFDEEGDSLGVDMAMISAVYGVLKAVSEGDEDVMLVLMGNCPLQIDAEELEEAQESSEGDYEDSEVNSDKRDDDEDDDENGYVDSEYEGGDFEEASPELESEFRDAAVNEDFD